MRRRRPDAISKNGDIFDHTIYRWMCASFCYATIAMAIRNPRLAYYFYFLSFLLSAVFCSHHFTHTHSLSRVGHTLLRVHVIRSNLMNKVCANCVYAWWLLFTLLLLSVCLSVSVSGPVSVLACVWMCLLVFFRNILQFIIYGDVFDTPQSNVLFFSISKRSKKMRTTDWRNRNITKAIKKERNVKCACV